MNGAAMQDVGPCLKCGLSYEQPIVPVPGSGSPPDPCLGWLRGVAQACCGHGGHGRSLPYVVFGPDAQPGDGACRRGLKSLYGADALAFFAVRGVGPDLIDLRTVA